MQDQQVELLHTELAGGLVEGVQRLLVAVVVDPDLGLQEDLVTRDAGIAQALPDLALVAVGRGGVDQAVSGAQRGLDGLGRLLRLGLVDAEPDHGHLDAVVQDERAGGILQIGHLSIMLCGRASAAGLLLDANTRSPHASLL